MGLSVTIGLRGIHIKLRFNHSGQRFHFPILISPTLTPGRVIASLAIPTTVVMVVKTYVLKPAARRRRERTQVGV